MLLPDFSGLSVQEVTQVTAGSGLDLEILVRGRAVAQDPGPGAILAVPCPRVRVRFAAAGGEG